ncbi:hypothetical protein [Coprococcus sp. AF21-14LB]|uniref:hypothetical protein n=1 Tax=Coprococcus sp. AF21-14LB TaxID=2292231 RepID=UPI0018F14BFA|nr:hypothetical protein [Coprococcus sp. AF21-14LB]
MFKVYDDQDSGNICFGTEKDGQRYFIKFAGAPTERYNGNPADAIARRKATLPVYSELQHENLIEYVIFDMGRMWGSSLFQSPEEYEVGAVIDEITNVYTVGATAFALFGEYNRNRDRWQLSDKLFEVVAKAVSADRNGRQQSIRQLREEWETAICMES